MANAPSVLILGAGYAGLNAALRLNDHRRARSPAFELTLLDQHPYHLVKIRLHEAAARDAAVSIPLPGLFDGDGPVFHQAGVTGLDFGQRRVDTTTGDRKSTRLNSSH